ALRLLLLVDDALLLFVRLVAGHLALLCPPSSPTQRKVICCAASVATQQGRRGPAAVDIGDAQPFPAGRENRHHFQPLVHGLALGRTGQRCLIAAVAERGDLVDGADVLAAIELGWGDGDREAVATGVPVAPAEIGGECAKQWSHLGIGCRSSARRRRRRRGSRSCGGIAIRGGGRRRALAGGEQWHCKEEEGDLG